MPQSIQFPPGPQMAGGERVRRSSTRRSGVLCVAVAALMALAALPLAPAAAAEDSSGRLFEPGYAMSKQYVAVTAYKILRDQAPATVVGCASDVKTEPDRFADLAGAGAFTRGAINCLDKLGYLEGLPGGSEGTSGRLFEPGYAMSKQYVAVTAYKILRDQAPATVDGCASDVKTEPDRFADLAGAGAFTRGAINCLDKLGYLEGLPGGRDSLGALFGRAARQRQEIVAKLTKGIDSGAYGVGKDNILRGPAGFRIDLDDCASGWSDTTGITARQIRIGHIAPQSGSLSQFGNIAKGIVNYFDWINDNDPITVAGLPRDLTLIIKDDAYIAARTVELVDESIRSANVFALHTLGSRNTLAVYDKIDEECVPHPFVMAYDPAWGDPVNHPWTTGMELSYPTESVLWGTWIRENLTDLLPVKVASLAMDNNFGLAYEQSFSRWAQANPDVVRDYLPVRHDPALQTLVNEMKTVAAFEPDVYISMTAGDSCVHAIRATRETGLYNDINTKHGALFTTSGCRSVDQYMRRVGKVGNGWWAVGRDVKDSTDSKFVDEPFIAFMNSNLEAAGLNPASSSLYAVGYTYGYPYVEALRIAAELPGGLTRTNFILAVRSLSIEHPMYLDGIAAEFNGNRDAFFIEGSEVVRFDAAVQAWTRVGDVLDINSQTPNCSWDLDRGRCR